MTDSQILVAFGLAYFAIGIHAAFEPKKFPKLVDNLQDNPALAYVSGLFTMVVGYLIVLGRTWSADWSLVVTLLGWIALAKGFALVAMPKKALEFSECVTEKKCFRSVAPSVLFLAAAFTFALAWYLSR